MQDEQIPRPRLIGSEAIWRACIYGAEFSFQVSIVPTGNGKRVFFGVANNLQDWRNKHCRTA